MFPKENEDHLKAWFDAPDDGNPRSQLRHGVVICNYVFTWSFEPTSIDKCQVWTSWQMTNDESWLGLRLSVSRSCRPSTSSPAELLEHFTFKVQYESWLMDWRKVHHVSYVSYQSRPTRTNACPWSLKQHELMHWWVGTWLRSARASSGVSVGVKELMVDGHPSEWGKSDPIRPRN